MTDRVQLGRPTKLTPRARDRILEAVSGGCSRQVAAQSAGIGESTLYSWIERGETDQAAERRTAFREFVEALRAREAASVAKALDVIHGAAAGGDWRAAAWFLERRYPDRFGRQTRRVDSHDDGQKKTLADLMAELEAAEAAGELEEDGGA